MQNYTEIPSAQTLQSSLSLLLDNYKTIMSCFSGTTFPSTNLYVGMLCLRTDQKKLYQLMEVIEGVPSWFNIADLSSDMSTQMGEKLSAGGGKMTGRLTIDWAAPSTSTTSGALVVTGGAGFGGDVFAQSFNGALKGNAATASKLETSREISLVGGATAEAIKFDGSKSIALQVSELAAGSIRGTIPQDALSGSYTIDVSALGGFKPSRQLNGAGFVPTVSGGDGVMEIGRYVDFHTTGTSTEDYSVRLDGGGAGSTTMTLIGSFVATGNVTAFSDERLKKNIKRLEGATAKIRKINGVTFSRSDAKPGQKRERYVGVLAQDVQKALPEAVKAQKGGLLSVDYMGLFGLAVEAIKEMDARIKEMEIELKQSRAKAKQVIH